MPPPRRRNEGAARTRVGRDVLVSSAATGSRSQTPAAWDVSTPDVGAPRAPAAGDRARVPAAASDPARRPGGDAVRGAGCRRPALYVDTGRRRTCRRCCALGRRTPSGCPARCRCRGRSPVGRSAIAAIVGPGRRRADRARPGRGPTRRALRSGRRGRGRPTYRAARGCRPSADLPVALCAPGELPTDAGSRRPGRVGVRGGACMVGLGPGLPQPATTSWPARCSAAAPRRTGRPTRAIAARAAAVREPLDRTTRGVGRAAAHAARGAVRPRGVAAARRAPDAGDVPAAAAALLAVGHTSGAALARGVRSQPARARRRAPDRWRRDGVSVVEVRRGQLPRLGGADAGQPRGRRRRRGAGGARRDGHRAQPRPAAEMGFDRAGRGAGPNDMSSRSGPTTTRRSPRRWPARRGCCRPAHGGRRQRPVRSVGAADRRAAPARRARRRTSRWSPCPGRYVRRRRWTRWTPGCR